MWLCVVIGCGVAYLHWHENHVCIRALFTSNLRNFFNVNLMEDKYNVLSQ